MRVRVAPSRPDGGGSHSQQDDQEDVERNAASFHHALLLPPPFVAEWEYISCTDMRGPTSALTGSIGPSASGVNAILRCAHLPWRSTQPFELSRSFPSPSAASRASP